MKRINILLLVIFSISGLHAQNAISSSGGEASGGGGTASYSVGQIVYHSYTDATGSLAEGVQQAYEISVVIGLEESEINNQISIYPNPASDYLVLKISDEISVGGNRWRASLYDAKGSEIKRYVIVSNVTNIDLAELVAETYFLKVSTDSRQVKTFKIIKTQRQ